MSGSAALHTEIDGTRRGLITLSVMLGSIMQALDNTIASVALPRVQGSVSATQDQMAWVLTSYIIAAAIMTPMSGWLASRFGRKRIILISISGFTVSSMLCGLAHTLPEIVSARLLQGVCGAALVPMSQAVLLDINPPERHGRAMALWVTGVTVGPILGPALGGWLTEHYNWRWVFFINVPFGIMSFLGIVSFMPETLKRRSQFDIFGFATLSVAIASLQLMLDRGQLRDWFSSTEIQLEATISTLAFYLFLVHMFTATRQSFVSASLFKDRNFVAGSVFIFVVGAVLFGTLALLPPLLEDLLNYPVVTTGIVTAPRGIGSLITMVIVGRIMDKVDARLIIAAGLAVTAFSMWQMTGFDLQMNTGSVVWSGLSQGLGAGLVYAPMASAAFATLTPGLRNEGTAIFSLMRNLGASVGISTLEWLLTRNTQIMHASLAAHVTPYSQVWPGQLVPTLPRLAELNAIVTRQAAMVAYIDDFKVMMVLSAAAIPLVLLLRIGSRTGSPVVAAE